MICADTGRDRTADGSVGIPLTLVSISYVSAVNTDVCFATSIVFPDFCLFHALPCRDADR